MSYPVQPPPPPAPRKKRKKWPWILGAVVLLAIIIGVATSGGGDKSDNKADSATPAASDAAAKPAEPEKTTEEKKSLPGLNQKVDDGKFDFTVTKVETGVASAGDNPYLKKDAQGQFVIISLTVKNGSNEPQSFFDTNQKLKDVQGREFNASSEAALALTEAGDSLLTEINPGNSATFKIVYDIPKDAVPAILEVHDSAFSDGAEIALK